MTEGQPRVGILVGASPDTPPYLKRFCSAMQDQGLELLTTETTAIDPRSIGGINFLVKVFPSRESVSDVVLGMALNNNTPVVLVDQIGQVPRWTMFEGRQVMCIDYLAETDLEASVRRIVFWMDGLEEEGQEREIKRFFTNGGLAIDYAKHAVSVGGEHVYLSPIEFNILDYLADNLDIALLGQEILTNVWGRHQKGNQHLLRVNVSRIRSKIGEDVNNQTQIVTIAAGYMMPKIEESEEAAG